MPKQGGGGKAVDAGGSYKGKTVDGVKTKQPTLYRNEQWKSVQAPAIENPRECVGKVVSVDGNFWTGSSLEESIVCEHYHEYLCQKGWQNGDCALRRDHDL